MRLLLDTHVLLWWFLRSERLPKKTSDILANPKNSVYVSAVSTWEISIKAALGKLRLPGDLTQYLPDRIAQARLSELAITPAHTYGVAALPAHHSDPFDRLLIAQAQHEALTIVTSDRVFQKYDVKKLAV